MVRISEQVINAKRLPNHTADASWIVEKVIQNIPNKKIKKCLTLKNLDDSMSVTTRKENGGDLNEYLNFEN